MLAIPTDAPAAAIKPSAPPPILSSRLTLSVADTVSPPSVDVTCASSPRSAWVAPVVLLPVPSGSLNRLSMAPDLSWFPMEPLWASDAFDVFMPVTPCEPSKLLSTSPSVGLTTPAAVLSRSMPRVTTETAPSSDPIPPPNATMVASKVRWPFASTETPRSADATESVMSAATVSWTVITSTATPAPANRPAAAVPITSPGKLSVSLAKTLSDPRDWTLELESTVAVVSRRKRHHGHRAADPDGADCGRAGLGAELLGRVGTGVGVAAGKGLGPSQLGRGLVVVDADGDRTAAAEQAPGASSVVELHAESIIRGHDQGPIRGLGSGIVDGRFGRGARFDS